MRVLLIIAIALITTFAVAVIIVLVIGSRLPATHIASRSIRLGQPPQNVYTVVRDFGSAADWRPDVKTVEMMGDENGVVRFRENGGNGVINYELVEDVPAERIVTRIADRDLGYAGSWTYEFTPDGEGSLVTITEDGEVSNIFFRFMSRYVFGHTSTLDAYLKALAARFGESAPEPAPASHNQ